MSVPAAYIGIILIWSTTPLAVKWSGEGGGFLFGVTGRMVLGALVCLIALKAMGTSFPWHRQSRRAYIAAIMGIYGAMLCVYWGAQFIPSGLISVLFGLTPVSISIMSTLWLKERELTLGRLAGMAVGIAGLVVVFRTEHAVATGAWQGIVAILGAVLIQSSSTVWVKRIGAALPTTAINSGGLIIAVTLFLTTWLLYDGHWPHTLPVRAELSIVYLGVLGTALGFNLYFYVLRHLPAATVGLITLVTPVTALLLGGYLNGEAVHAGVWIGTALILAGLALHQWGHRLRPAGARRAVT